jgi:nitrate reductase delta subunit
VPLFLEFLSQLDEAAGALLGDAVHVLAHIGRKLRPMRPYAPSSRCWSAESRGGGALSEPPIRDMDEALETFVPARTASSRCCSGPGPGRGRRHPSFSPAAAAAPPERRPASHDEETS